VSSPTPPTVLLDRSFLVALGNGAIDAAEDRERAVECYRSLVDRYEAREIRLRARTDVLDAVSPRARTFAGFGTLGTHADLLAPVERIHIAGQHRRAAARLRLPVAVEPDTALTLVLMRRESITQIATFEPVFEEFDLTVLPER